MNLARWELLHNSNICKEEAAIGLLYGASKFMAASQDSKANVICKGSKASTVSKHCKGMADRQAGRQNKQQYRQQKTHLQHEASSLRRARKAR